MTSKCFVIRIPTKAGEDIDIGHIHTTLPTRLLRRARFYVYSKTSCVKISADSEKGISSSSVDTSSTSNNSFSNTSSSSKDSETSAITSANSSSEQDKRKKKLNCGIKRLQRVIKAIKPLRKRKK